MVRWDDAYFAAVGVVVAVTGVGQMGLGILGGQVSLGILTVSGTFLLWRGFILAAAGVFYVQAGSTGLEERRQQAIVVTASVMLWIVAGVDLLSRVLGAIPGGPDGWIASGAAIAGSVLPPYSPAIVAVPFSLVAIQYIRAQPEQRGVKP